MNARGHSQVIRYKDYMLFRLSYTDACGCCLDRLSDLRYVYASVSHTLHIILSTRYTFMHLWASKPVNSHVRFVEMTI